MELIWYAIIYGAFLAGLISTIVPGMPGMVLIFAGQMFYAWVFGLDGLDTRMTLVLVLLTVFGTLVNYASTPLVRRRAGPSPYAAVGALTGGVAGALLLGPLGLAAGPLAGVVLGETVAGSAPYRAAEVGWPTVVSGWAALLLQIVTAVSMLVIFFTILR